MVNHLQDRVLMTDDEAPAVETEPDSAFFKQQLLAVSPHLRAFARGLTGRAAQADDLVQDTLMKAWASRAQFQPGTNFKAWCFVILRNTFSSAMRREKFVGEWDDAVAERILSAPATQANGLHLEDLQRALLELPTDQREAVLLVGAGGMSYEDAAVACQCAVGTIKSRVSRARAMLDKLTAYGGLVATRQDVSSENALADIMKSTERLMARTGQKTS
jgi:RNA polymerase sigma-70 factor, ECF subfamily